MRLISQGFDRYFDTGKRERGHIPFRDRASQDLMRAPQEKENVQTGTQAEPELEPASPEEPEADMQEALGDMTDESVDGDDTLPAETYPTLEQYKALWARRLAEHSKVVPGEFSRDNLVPEPVLQLWQDCPYVPFDKLKSDDAMARLSRCRPISGFTPAHVEDGVIRYAHNTGETNFRRRAPLQLAATLGTLKIRCVYFKRDHSGGSMAIPARIDRRCGRLVARVPPMRFRHEKH